MSNKSISKAFKRYISYKVYSLKNDFLSAGQKSAGAVLSLEFSQHVSYVYISSNSATNTLFFKPLYLSNLHCNIILCTYNNLHILFISDARTNTSIRIRQAEQVYNVLFTRFFTLNHILFRTMATIIN